MVKGPFNFLSSLISTSCKLSLNRNPIVPTRKINKRHAADNTARGIKYTENILVPVEHGQVFGVFA